MKPSPPKVILIYLWKAPFALNGDRRVNNPVYKSHAKMAKKFHFVVGHVNLKNYFDELNSAAGLGLRGLKRLFLADVHHPNSLGHLSISFLLMNLLRYGRKWTNSKHQEQRELENYDWFCGNETKDKSFLRSRVVGDSIDADLGWQSPVGVLS